MKKAKATSLRINDVVDKRKPMVKEFVDPDKAVMQFLLLRLPFVRSSTPSPRLVYQNKEKTIYRFRVNWWAESGIIHSKYYEVSSHDSQMAMTER